MVKLMFKKISVTKVCAFGAAVNLILFFVKLYIGLRTNSISIYSDAVNNAFDSLSGVFTFWGLTVAFKKSNGVFDGTVQKTEQLFSFIISLTVIGAGCYFAYNSLERLMYPTPIWFEMLYVWIIAGTAAVKGLMFVLYRRFEKATKSPVVGAIKTDCILDMFITLITLATLIVSKYETYAVDAYCGILISVIIIVFAVRLMFSNARALINFVSPEIRTQIKTIFDEYSQSVELLEISYLTEKDGIKAFATVRSENKTVQDEIYSKCLQKNGVRIYFVEDNSIQKEGI